MGLYLAVFDDGEELEGVEVGSYADFEALRSAIAEHLEGRQRGSRFPTLMLHSDCDGSWSPEESSRLEKELREIGKAFRSLPPVKFESGSWQHDVAKTFGIEPRNLYESFFDVDGEPLIERLLQLAQVSQKHDKDILFQ